MCPLTHESGFRFLWEVDNNSKRLYTILMPKLDMIGLVVEDIPTSLRFYRRLGLDVPEPDAGEPYVETTLPGGIRLSWNAAAMIKEIAGESWTPPTGQRMGLAFLCDTPAQVDELHSDLVASGYRSEREPWNAFWGQRYAQVVDPDGMVVDLFAPLSQSPQ